MKFSRDQLGMNSVNQNHERIKIFLWRLLANVLPLRGILAERFDLRDKGCLFCDKDIETPKHLFLKCNFIRSLAFASHWGLKLDILAADLSHLVGIEDLIDVILDPPKSIVGGLVINLL